MQQDEGPVRPDLVCVGGAGVSISQMDDTPVSVTMDTNPTLTTPPAKVRDRLLTLSLLESNLCCHMHSYKRYKTLTFNKCVPPTPLSLWSQTWTSAGRASVEATPAVRTHLAATGVCVATVTGSEETPAQVSHTEEGC